MLEGLKSESTARFPIELLNLMKFHSFNYSLWPSLLRSCNVLSLMLNDTGSNPIQCIFESAARLNGGFLLILKIGFLKS